MMIAIEIPWKKESLLRNFCVDIFTSFDIGATISLQYELIKAKLFWHSRSRRAEFSLFVEAGSSSRSPLTITSYRLWWRNVLFCHLIVDFFLFRVSTQALNTTIVMWLLISGIYKVLFEEKKAFVLIDWYVVPTGKDNVIVSAGRTKVIPAGSTILVLQIYNQTSKIAEQDTPPPTITTMKIHIIKKGEYDIWSMRIRQYICHTDHNLWDLIVNGDLEEEAEPAREQSGPPAPKTAKQLTAKRNQERVKSILLLEIHDEYVLKFHNVTDAKSLWAAIKSRFRGNDESNNGYTGNRPMCERCTLHHIGFYAFALKP
ncbi:hypothetical protein Tco_0005358 [Tanacetum coccineum]